MAAGPHHETLGVSFPVTDGRRSTTATGQAVLADAARAVDPQLAADIEAEDDWRRGYLVHARRLLEARLTTPVEPAAVPLAGLSSLHDRFEYVDAGGTISLAAATARGDRALATAEVKGEGADAEQTLSVPYRGTRLEGDALHRQLDRWVDEGIAEPSFARAIRLVMDNPEWLDLSDRTFVILGAAAEMGPMVSLCRWGAHVVPVDLPVPALWDRVIEAVRRGRGRASVPVPAGQSPGSEELAGVAGADLIRDLPALATWLDRLDGPLTLGNYAYADGATHVQVSMAADALAVHLGRNRPDLSLAVLATPTDVFAVPEEVVEASQRQYTDAGAVRRIEWAVRRATLGRLFAENYQGLLTTPDGQRFGVADCLVPQQGPNYALAKRLQRWRATLARHEGHVVSVNVAPPTRTRSVMRNRVLAAAYAGARQFGVEVFDPSTSNTLMAALLVHDLHNPASAGNPDTALRHPLELFVEAANPGGLWRIPFAPRSVLGLAVALGMIPRGA